MSGGDNAATGKTTTITSSHSSSSHSIGSSNSSSGGGRRRTQKKREEKRDNVNEGDEEAIEDDYFLRKNSDVDNKLSSDNTSTTSEDRNNASPHHHHAQSQQQHYGQYNNPSTYLDKTSISEAISASETLEEFEERERQITKQLKDEALQKKTKEDSASNFVPDSVQNRQSLVDIRQESFAGESEESDDAQHQGYPLGPLVDPPPAYHLHENQLKMAARGERMERRSSMSPQVTPGFEPPTPPASMFPFSGLVTVSPDEYHEYHEFENSPRETLHAKSADAAKKGFSIFKTNNPLDLKKAIGGSFAFAGGMAAAVAGNSPTINSDDIVYGSNLPSKEVPHAQSYNYEVINRSLTKSNKVDDNNNNNNKSKNNAQSNDRNESPYAITDELKEVLRCIDNYEAEYVEIEHVLQPFLLDFIPAVGDVDPFIKVPRPDEEECLLGLTVLDEPSEMQSDSAVLDLRLHQMSKSAMAADTPVKKLSRADRNKQQIERWIMSTREARKSRPLDRVHYADGPMPTVERLMQEWPDQVEQLLHNVTLPTSKLDVSLEEYTDICLSLTDIPVHNGRRIQALHLLFSLYSEFKNSQHFRNLAANNIYNNNNSSSNNNNNNTSTYNNNNNNTRRQASSYNNRLEL